MMETVLRRIRTFVSNPIIQMVVACIKAIVVCIKAIVVCIIVIIVWELFPTHHDLLISIVASFAASLVAVLIALCLDRQIRAKLEIASIPKEEDNEETTPTHRKFLHVNVTNPPLEFPYSLFHDRHTAPGTWAEIQFYPYPVEAAQEFPKSIFDNPMPGKWRENQLPKFGDDYKKSKKLPRGFKDTCDIPSGKDIRNHLDIAMNLSLD